MQLLLYLVLKELIFVWKNRLTKSSWRRSFNFIAFAPKENPKIYRVYVENGGWVRLGSTNATLMIEKYLKNKITNKDLEFKQLVNYKTLRWKLLKYLGKIDGLHCSILITCIFWMDKYLFSMYNDDFNHTIYNLDTNMVNNVLLISIIVGFVILIIDWVFFITTFVLFNQYFIFNYFWSRLNLKGE